MEESTEPPQACAEQLRSNPSSELNGHLQVSARTSSVVQRCLVLKQLAPLQDTQFAQPT